MTIRNGIIGNDRTTAPKTASVRKQLGTKHGGVKGRDRSAEELERDWRGAVYSGQATLKGWRMTGYQREQQSYVSRAGGDEGGQG